MQLDGKSLTGLTPRETIDAGLGFVPEDRKQDGFVGTFTVAENLILNHLRRAAVRARDRAWI